MIRLPALTTLATAETLPLVLSPKEKVTTVDLTVNYLRPLTVSINEAMAPPCYDAMVLH